MLVHAAIARAGAFGLAMVANGARAKCAGLCFFSQRHEQQKEGAFRRARPWMAPSGSGPAALGHAGVHRLRARGRAWTGRYVRARVFCFLSASERHAAAMSCRVARATRTHGEEPSSIHARGGRLAGNSLFLYLSTHAHDPYITPCKQTKPQTKKNTRRRPPFEQQPSRFNRNNTKQQQPWPPLPPRASRRARPSSRRRRAL
jgi:hypothetical protein